jgi:hypothetical protein
MYKKDIVVVQKNVVRIQVGKLFEDVWVRFAFEPIRELAFEVHFFKYDIVHEPYDDDASKDEPQEAVRGHVTYFEERVYKHEHREGVPQERIQN